MGKLTQEQIREILDGFVAFRTQTGRKDFSSAGPSTIAVRDFLYVYNVIRAICGVDEDGKVWPFFNTNGVQQASVVDLATGGTDPFVLLQTYMQYQAGFQDAFNPTIGPKLVSTGSAPIDNRKPRIGFVQSALTSGAINDVELVPALSGYYGVIRVLGFVSDTADTYNLTFQDEDDAACVGSIDGRIDVVIATPYVPVKIGPQSSGVVVWNTNDNKGKEYDVAGGAGVEKVGIIYEWWYET